MQTPHEIVRKQEQDYISGDTNISEHVSFSVRDNINRIEAYLFSKHISGDKDSLGRDKPFFNIVTAASNIWYRATDIDRANIRIKATKQAQHTTALLADVKSKEWMRKAGVGVWLNDWGRTLARYGSAVSKFVEQDGKLVATIVPWNRLIVDSIDFYGNPIIEKHYYTPAQLRKHPLLDQDEVEALITQALTSRESLGKENKDNKADYLEVYELHGEFSKALITDRESDERVFTQQVHILSFVQEGDGKDGKKEYLDYTLYSGQEKNPYHISHLVKEDGRVMAIGAVEHLFEAQWMVNHNEKAIKDQLDLASKLIFQTSDPSYQGKNAHNLDTGSILYHEQNQPLTQLANTSHDIGSLQNSATSWKMNSGEQTSSPDALKGNTMPSSTAARQVEALQQEAHSLFELMTENKGLALEEIWREFVIPFIKKQLNTKDEIVAVLDDVGVREIDAIYLPNKAKKIENERVKKEMLAYLKSPINGNTPFPEAPDVEGTQAGLQKEMQALGNTRYYKPSEMTNKTWKEVFKDFEWDVEVQVTNEQSNKLANLTTLTTVLANLASMGDTQNARMVLSKILEETGTFSPMELTQLQAAPVQPAAAMNPEDLAPEETPQLNQ